MTDTMDAIINRMDAIGKRISNNEAVTAEDRQRWESYRRNFDPTWNDRSDGRKDEEEMLTAKDEEIMGATEALLMERGKTHGDFVNHAGCTIDLINTIGKWMSKSEKKHFTPVQSESLRMICHKIGRIVAGDPDFRDHWDDIAGYAKLASSRCSK